MRGQVRKGKSGRSAATRPARDGLEILKLSLPFQRRTAGIGMPDETFYGERNNCRCYFANGNQPNTGHDAGRSRRCAYMRGLTQQAGCFLLGISVAVRCDV